MRVIRRTALFCLVVASMLQFVPASAAGHSGGHSGGCSGGSGFHGCSSGGARYGSSSVHYGSGGYGSGGYGSSGYGSSGYGSSGYGSSGYGSGGYSSSGYGSSCYGSSGYGSSGYSSSGYGSARYGSGGCGSGGYGVSSYGSRAYGSAGFGSSAYASSCSGYGSSASPFQNASRVYFSSPHSYSSYYGRTVPVVAFPSSVSSQAMTVESIGSEIGALNQQVSTFPEGATGDRADLQGRIADLHRLETNYRNTNGGLLSVEQYETLRAQADSLSDLIRSRREIASSFYTRPRFGLSANDPAQYGAYPGENDGFTDIIHDMDWAFAR